MSARVIAYMLTALTMPLAALAERSGDPAHGLWLTENQKAIIEVAPCGAGETCGRMVWVEEAVDETGAPKRDSKNVDQAKRDRTICGLELVGGLHRSGDGAWTQGWVYNPRNGETYSAELRTLSAGELEVRGYVGMSLLGRSQVWTRVSDDRGGCSS